MEGSYTDPVTGEIQENFLEVHSTSQRANPAFRLNRFATSFAIKNLDRCSNPEALLHKIFQSSIKQACDKTPGKTNKISVRIESDLLKKGPIEIPYRSLRMNTPKALLTTFVKTEQSATEESLYGAPIRLTITTISGQSGGHRSKGMIIGNINQECLIKINNPDNLCLIYALEMSRVYATVGKTDGMSRVSFHRLIKRGLSQGPCRGPKSKYPTMLEYGKNLLVATGISADLSSYSVEEHVPLIQKYYNAQYPGLYRIVVFSVYGML